MIIQCDKCKTRFKLDDSRVTDAGIRVRCSRCSHTFVVQRDEPEEDSDFDAILQGLGGNTAVEQGEDDDSPVDEEKSFADTPALQDEEFVEDVPPADASSEDNRYLADSDSWVAEDQDPEVSSHDFPTHFEGTGTASEKGGTTGQSFTEQLRKGGGLPQFQMPAGSHVSGKVPDPAGDKMASDHSGPVDNAPTPDDPLPDEEFDISTAPVHADLPGASLEPSPVNKTERSPSVREHLWPVADSKDEESPEENFSPLSISSRRKGSPLVPVLMGILLILLMAGAGFYLYTPGSGSLADLLPESAKAVLAIGKKSGGLVEIRSLDGAFLANKDVGEIFVMKGEAFNVSSKPLTTIQVKGKIFGPKGEIIAQQTVFCGNVLSGEQLVMQPYSSMLKVMGNEFGETLANFQLQPGKGIPFVIVFKDVPQGARDFGAEVVSPVNPDAR